MNIKDIKINLKPLRYLDVIKGKYVYNKCIHINDGIIEKINDKGSGLNLEGITLIPGLIDTHVHITYHFPWEKKDGIKNNQMKTLNAGFTTIRDLGSEKIVEVLDDDFSPNIIWAGKPIFKKDLKNKSIKDNLKERINSEAIKIFESKNNLISLKDLKEIVKTSTVPVAIHAIHPEEVEIASASGCRSIEHCSYIDKFHFNKNTYVCPTFSNPSQYLNNFNQYDYMFKDNMQEVKKYFEGIRDNNVQNISKIYPKAKLVFGTDSVAGMHGNNHYEFNFLKKLGLSNIEMIRLATIDAAEMLMIDNLGIIEEGCYADIIGVIGDPLKDINDLSNIVFVMKNGTIFVFKDEE